MTTFPIKSAPIPTQLPKGVSHAHTTPTGSVTTTVHGSRLVLVKVTGHMDLEITPHIMEPINKVMSLGQRVVVFHDWEQLDSYEGKVRSQLTDWALRNRTRIESVYVLQRSKMVSMAVSVANLALGGMLNPFTDRTRFEQRFLEVHKQMVG